MVEALDSSFRIPVIDFPKVCSEKKMSQGWQELCNTVREACENYGCFEVVYHDKISPQLHGEAFSVMKELFSLPIETKKKNVNPKPFHGYYHGYPTAPLYESFGMEDATNMDSFKSFVDLMWPDHGHHHFSQTMSSMVKQMDELNRMIGMSILDGYGLGEKLESIMGCNLLVRVMRYKAPPQGEYVKGLGAHTDKPLSALLCSDQVFGIEIETKGGQWIQLSPSPNSFIFFVGDPLMAWSNGRMHSAKHGDDEGA